MATLTPPPPPPSKQAGEVTAHLRQAAGKIRFHDLTVGGLLVTVWILAYIAGMIVLDKYFDLDVWVRQAGWCGFVIVLGSIAYRWLVRPLRASVNPLYAAKRVEETVPDAKNGIINWVDLQDATMPDSVRAAVTAKAARQLANADVGKALESRLLVWTGSAVAALVVLLAVLFLVFKPSVFASLVGRAVNPFSSGVVATRTSLTLTQPAGGDLTLTAGQPVVIAVTVSGRVPDAAAPDRIRVLLKHSPGDVNAEEVPLEPIASGEWSVRVPEYLVQNGFWYRVAGGDTETAEYRVTVRPRPVFKAFQIQYEYPAYLNMKPETSTDPHLEAYRGTTVTITATANRELKDGRMTVAGISTPVVGTVNGAARDMLSVKFVMMENSTYRLFFTATNTETNIDSPPYSMKVITDQAPVVTFKPSQIDGQILPLNGLLALDADATDDFGLDKLTLKLKIENGATLAGHPYLKGASLQRETDRTWPLTLEYKDSIKLGGLKTEAGQAADLKEGAILEYWLEAADNCTVPQANVGKSKVYKVRLGPPIVDPAQKTEQQKVEDARKNDETTQQKTQAAQNQNQPRPHKPGPQEQKNEDKSKEQNPASPDQKQPGSPDQKQPGSPDQKQPGSPDQKQPGSPDQKQPGSPDQKQPGSPDQKQPGSPDQKQPGSPDQKQPGSPDQKQPGSESQAEKDLKQKAEQVQKEIDKQNREAGQPKTGEPQPPGASQEPNPATKKEDGKKPEEKNADSKPTPGATATGDTSKNQPSDPKDDGKPKQTGQSEPKNDGGTPGKSGAENKPMDKSNPKDGVDSGKEKPMPQGKNDGSPMTGDSGNEPGSTKGAPEKDPKGGENTAKPKSKPGEQKPGETKPGDEKPMPGESGSEKQPGTEQPPAAGLGKPQESPKPGAAKPEQNPKAGGTPLEAPKAEAKQPGDTKPGEPKPGDAAAKPKDGGANEPNAPPKAGEKPTPDDKARKEIEDAARDLAGNDAAKKQAARDKLDKAVGKEAREGAEKMMDDLKSDDKATRDAAEKMLEDMKEKMKDQMAGSGEQKPDAKTGPGGEKNPDPKKAPGSAANKPDPKEIENAAKDLAGNDEAKKQAAREKLDKMVGKDAREQAEKMANDLKSDDKATREAAEKKLKDMMDQAKGAGEPGNDPGKPGTDPAKAPTAEEMMQATDLAKDLNSKDAAKRRNAEKELEKMMGKENRDKLKDEMAKNDHKPGEPLSDALSKKLEDLANDGKPAKDPFTGGPPGGSNAPGGKPLTVDEEFAKRSSQMQLIDKMKKAQANPDLLKKLGWTQEDYDRFLKGYEEMVQRDDMAKSDPTNPNAAKAPPVPTINTGTAGRVESRVNGSTVSPQAGGITNPPPGYTDAQKAFFKKANQAKDGQSK